MPTQSPRMPTPPAGRAKAGAGLILALSFAGFCFTLLVYAPGYMSADSLDQLLQARSGVFKDNHPPLMAAIWSLTDRVSSGPFGVLFLQTLAFWASIAVFFIYARGWVGAKVAGVLVVGLFPPIFGQIGTIWKDLLMLIAFLLAVGLILRFQKKGGLFWILVIFFLLFIGCSMRHNGVVAIPPLVFWLAHSFKFIQAQRRSLTALRAAVLAVAGSIVLYAASSIMSNRLTDAKSNLWQALAIYDVVGISVFADENLLPDETELLRRPVELDHLKTIYKQHTVSALYRGWKDGSGPPEKNRFRVKEDEESLAALSLLWKKSILENPMAYLKHRVTVFAHLIGYTDDPVDTPIYGLYGPRIVENELGLVFHPSELNEKLTDWFISMSKTPLYRVWRYLVALLVLLVIGIWMYHKSGTPVVLALSLSGLCYIFPYFFVAASSNFRYSLWGILMAVLCVCYLGCLGTARAGTSEGQTHEDHPATGRRNETDQQPEPRIAQRDEPTT